MQQARGDGDGLWVVATWFEEVAQVAPILNFKSPVHRCGKSTCLAIVGRLVKRRLLSSNTTPAALFRAIEKFQPTLVIDEADSFFGQTEELRGIINSGHTRETAFTLRTVGDELEPKTFSTWRFKAIAGIGRLAVTIEEIAFATPIPKSSKIFHAGSPGGRAAMSDRCPRRRFGLLFTPTFYVAVRWLSSLLRRHAN